MFDAQQFQFDVVIVGPQPEVVVGVVVEPPFEVVVVVVGTHPGVVGCCWTTA